MNRSDPKADEEHGASEDSGQESSEQGSEQASDDGDGDTSEDSKGSLVGEDKARGRQPTPVASRVRSRSGGDSYPPRAVKRLNLGRPAQQATVGHVDQGGGVLSAMNQLDLRGMSARAVDVGVDPRVMYARAAVAPVARPSDSEEEHGCENSGGDYEDISEEGSGQGSEQGFNEADDEGNADADEESADESSQDPDEEGTGSGTEVHKGDSANEAWGSGGDSSQETEGSLYIPCEDSPSGGSANEASGSVGGIPANKRKARCILLVTSGGSDA